MKRIIGYLKAYIATLNLKAFGSVSLLMAILIYFNYTAGLERTIMSKPTLARLGGSFSLYLFVLGSAWLLQSLFVNTVRRPPLFFYVLLIASCLIFAIKVSADELSGMLTAGLGFPWDRYVYMTLNWPLKCALVLILVTIVWRVGKYEGPVAGMQLKGFDLKPYFGLLLMMVPLIALAGTQADFQHTYPKVQRIAFIDDFTVNSWPYKLLYELSYGIDFLTIEAFFRGFLILAFARYAGANAILPMAAFYCCIHFGKPLGECITSYFGGLILGVVVLNTRNIWGGLIVHLGIAWLMELVAFIL
ncbi:CPBP family intramembrane glutamic endopeptidase [Paraflavitalea sp. CAU 1676]|uniref:CPBP family intramembrane glutamic endopeptidase n=1 Tax=Paraflavitalea sp. CAU 1676 TaxID=3032598 RepID=UPI0023DBC007|nr:CPBP family intramembrane glutamic endopeptidase [Paraflavitalea sp. CAU 1676]MDF2191932.1 CPBP family intramembrane metalloprotease [Paraflavitalea sp. CAU 1676]